MAAESKKSFAINKLTPNSIDIKVDGDDIRVPTDRIENTFFNMVLAAQMRRLFQESLKDYKDKGVFPTPKELRDLAEGAKAISSFSTEVYSIGDGIDITKGQNPSNQRETESGEAIDLSSLVKPKPVEEQNPE